MKRVLYTEEREESMRKDSDATASMLNALFSSGEDDDGILRALSRSAYENMSTFSISHTISRGLSRGGINLPELSREIYKCMTHTTDREGLIGPTRTHNQKFDASLEEALNRVSPQIETASVGHFYKIGDSNPKDSITHANGNKILLMHKGYLSFKPQLNSFDEVGEVTQRFVNAFTDFANQYSNQNTDDNTTFGMKIPGYLCDLLCRNDNIVFYNTDKNKIEGMRKIAMQTFSNWEIDKVENPSTVPKAGQDYFDENTQPIESYNKVLARVVANEISREVRQNPSILKNEVNEEGDLHKDYILGKIQSASHMSPQEMYETFTSTQNKTYTGTSQ